MHNCQLDHMGENLEFKAIAIDGTKEDELGVSTIYGYASVKNVLDAVNDVVVDGAYSDLASTLKTGFICNSHEHDEPIGYFTKVVEDEYGLYIEAKFHGTDCAQEQLQIIKERLQAGKECTMSIGYKVLESEFGQFKGKSCRFLKSIFVKEASVTLVPANDKSVITGLKSRATQFEQLKIDLIEYKTRILEINELGRGEKWANERKTEIEELEKAISELKLALTNNFSDTLVTEQKTQSEDLGSSNELELIKVKALASLSLEVK